jgi:hypothetical protein
VVEAAVAEAAAAPGSYAADRVSVMPPVAIGREARPGPGRLVVKGVAGDAEKLECGERE